MFGRAGSIQVQGGSGENKQIQLISHGIKAVNETRRRLTYRKGLGVTWPKKVRCKSSSGTLCGVQRGPSRPLVTGFLWPSRDLGKGLWSCLQPGPGLLLGLLCCCCSVTLVLLLFSHSCCCCVWLFATSQTAVRQASLSFTISLSLLRLMSVEPVMPSNHLILCHPLLLLPSIFASIRVSLTLRPRTSIWSQGSQAGILYQALSFYVHMMFST